MAPKSEVNFLIGYLFGDEEGRAIAERIDRHIHRLPGLGGLDIVVNARKAHLSPTTLAA